MGPPIVTQSLLETGKATQGFRPAVEDVGAEKTVSPAPGGAGEERQGVPRASGPEERFGFVKKEERVHGQ